VQQRWQPVVLNGMAAINALMSGRSPVARLTLLSNWQNDDGR